MAAKGVRSLELDKLISLENDPQSWLHMAKEMRDHSTHRRSVPRVFHVGGENNGQVFLTHPKSGEVIEEDYDNTFEAQCCQMEALLNELRETAVRTYQSNNSIQRTR